MAKKVITPFDEVTVNIPLVKNEPDTVYVSVNEKNYEIKKGEDVKVPRFVADMLVDNQEQTKRNVLFIRGSQPKE